MWVRSVRRLELGETVLTKGVSTGSGFELYGAIQQVPGNVTVSYNLDSGHFRDTVVLNHGGVTFEGLPANRTHWVLNRRLFHQPNLSGFEDREHTLEVAVDGITGDQVSPNTLQVRCIDS